MLYVYYGEDIATVRAKVHATVTKMLSKNSDALYFRITPEDFANYNLEELTLSQGLFKNEYVVVFDSLLSESSTAEVVLAALESLAEASHPFFIVESKLTAPVKKKLEKYAKSVQEVAGKKKDAKGDFNVFSLTDALGQRSSREAWVLLQQALSSGIREEEIHGVMFWFYKTVALAASAGSAEAAGLKAYPYNKARSALARFENADEVYDTVTFLALLPYEARVSGVPLSIRLEKFILTQV